MHQHQRSLATPSRGLAAPDQGRGAQSALTLVDAIGWIERHELVALAALLLVALATRLVALGTLPDTLNPDEADNIQSAVRVVYGSPPDNGFFGFDWYGEPAFTAYVFALFLHLFGVTQFAARLPTALASVISLGLFYLVLRRQTAVPAALLATLLLGSQLWYLHLSRMAWNNLHVTLFTLAAMLSLLRALEATSTRRAALWFAACGVCCALSLYGYPAGRLLLPSLFVVLPLALLRHRSRKKRTLIGYSSIACIAVLLFVPEGLYVSRHWDGFAMRLSAVNILNKPAFQAAPLAVLGTQLEANALGFWVGSFNNVPGHFPPGEPLLDRVTGVLVAAGMLASLLVRRFRRRFETWLWWSVFLVGWFFTEVITDRTPDGARGIGWMPALLFFAALSLELELARAARLGVRGRAAAVAGVAVAAVLVAGADLLHYVEWSGLPATRQARDPYVTVAEFPAWSAAIIEQAQQHGPGFNVGQWRAEHPLTSSGTSLLGSVTSSLTTTIGMTPVQPPMAPADWPPVLRTFGQDGPGRLSEPRGIALDQADNVYVLDADPQEPAIKKFDAAGVFQTSWGPHGTEDGTFQGAWAVVIDAQQHVLVLDQDTGWVQVFDTDGHFLGKWGGPRIGLYHPRAMALAPSGAIYIADTGVGRTLRFSSSGQIEAVLGPSPAAGSGSAGEPAGVLPRSDGTVLVADAKRGLLRTYDPSGMLLASWGFKPATALDGPRLALAPDGSVYATLPEACGIARIGAAGEVVGSFGACGANDYLQRPGALLVDPSGTLYVGDVQRHLVVVLRGR